MPGSADRHGPVSALNRPPRLRTPLARGTPAGDPDRRATGQNCKRLNMNDTGKKKGTKKPKGDKPKTR